MNLRITIGLLALMFPRMLFSGDIDTWGPYLLLFLGGIFLYVIYLWVQLFNDGIIAFDREAYIDLMKRMGKLPRDW